MVCIAGGHTGYSIFYFLVSRGGDPCTDVALCCLHGLNEESRLQCLRNMYYDINNDRVCASAPGHLLSLLPPTPKFAQHMRHLAKFISGLLRPHSSLANSPISARHRRTRFFASTSSTSRAGRPPKDKDRFNYNPEVFFDEAPDPEHMAYTRVTSNDLEKYTKPPTRVKMLVRDFIEDSLYNPHYGYFPQQATIFTSAGEPINFRAIRDSVEFQNEVARRYSTYGTDTEGPGRQIWHTPTELFKVRDRLEYVLLLILAHSHISVKPSPNVSCRSTCSNTSLMRI